MFACQNTQNVILLQVSNNITSHCQQNLGEETGTLFFTCMDLFMPVTPPNTHTQTGVGFWDAVTAPTYL